jgi:UDP-glucose 4-epimerase
MRVLVTGAAGYIGSITVERLILAGHDVIALDDLSRGHQAAIHPAARFAACDLRDRDSVRSATDASGAEAILHFAALTLVGESVEQPAEYYQTNVIGGLNLLESARHAGVSRFVFSSTAAVYGEPTKLPLHEESTKEPINPYGWTKLSIEGALSGYAGRYGVNYAALRYFNVAGATAERGEDHRPETHLIPTLLLTLMGKRDTFVVNGTDFPTPDGTAVRDYVHVVDLADAHISALERLDHSLGPINLGTKDGFSVRQVIDAVERVTGRQVPTITGSRRAGDSAALVADTARARELLAWNPTHSTLEQMISSAWDWMRRNPDGYVR